ncbi:MAG: glutamate 5-kinase [Bacteroidales bacterium]|nr:glutamate 5-kinase [Bacteroidales bacterium]
MDRLLAIKIGSNVLTRADGRLDITRLSALVDQISDLRREGYKVIVITSGAVASGRSEIKVDHELDDVSQRQLFSSVGQARLMHNYYQFFKEQGFNCGQVLTTKDNFTDDTSYLNQKNCMQVMLDAGIIPVVNENDTVAIHELMFTDNDELASLIAVMMNVDSLIILSNVDGVFTGDPANPASKLIREIDPADDSILGYIGDSKSTNGRGGMKTKFSVARRIASQGIEVVIANGKRDDILTAILHGSEDVPYTRFKNN